MWAGELEPQLWMVCHLLAASCPFQCHGRSQSTQSVQQGHCVTCEDGQKLLECYHQVHERSYRIQCLYCIGSMYHFLPFLVSMYWYSHFWLPMQDGMSEQAGIEGQFVFCKLGTQSSNTSTNVLFSLKIGSNFSWMLHYLGESTGKSSLFASSPHVLTTVSHVEEILSNS